MGGLHSLGYEAVSDVRIGKYMEIRLDEDDAAVCGTRGSRACATSCWPTLSSRITVSRWNPRRASAAIFPKSKGRVSARPNQFNP